MRLVMRFLLVLLLMLVSCARAGELPREDFFRGQVRDQDTGKPLEGVLVVFYWERHVYSPKGIVREFHAATEVLTDSNGRFEVSAAPEETQDPSIYNIDGPAVIYFAPGYIQYRYEKDDVPRIYMKRAENPKDALNLRLQPGFPYHHTPLLLKALNDARARLGLPLIQPPAEGQRGK